MNHSGKSPFQIDKSEKLIPVTTEDYSVVAHNALNSSDEFLHIADPYDVQQNINLSFNDAFCANMMFACELYLKAILLFNKIKFTYKHSLKELFDILPVRIQTIIKSECSKAKQDNFDLQIKELSSAFVVFRYAYEYACLAYDFVFLAVLECALYTAAHNEIKE